MEPSAPWRDQGPHPAADPGAERALLAAPVAVMRPGRQPVAGGGRPFSAGCGNPCTLPGLRLPAGLCGAHRPSAHPGDRQPIHRAGSHLAPLPAPLL
ncbi:hypothetical protein D3C79_717010 [compost metagenome]